MDNKSKTFQEFRAYWQLSEEMIAQAMKEDLAETARILALLRDGSEALVGVLGMITGGELAETEMPMQ